jgi:two-component system, NtrC family, C4-dicarboxylate transport response regulator DctD
MPKINGKIIIVDDEKNVALGYKRNLERSGYEVEIFDSAKIVLSRLNNNWPGILISDVMMPEMDGFTLMKQALKIDPELPVILITGKGNISMAVQAMKDGAYDFVEKPTEIETFLEVVKRALEKRNFVMELRELRAEVSNQNNIENQIIGKSESIKRLRHVVQNVAQSHADILLLGETGTGKDLIAKCLHQNSKRKERNFVAINCGAIPESIIESELFGHESGAFTGAIKTRIGKFEFANQGTVFLDEIESMPLNLQVKLLRVLQERTVERMGSNKLISLDIRVIAATKIDLKEASKTGQFREDLYYRLNMVEIKIQPLRDRKEDIPILFQHFVAEVCKRYNQSIPQLSKRLFDQLLERDWEGNIRELKNEAEKHMLGLDMPPMEINSGFENSHSNIQIEKDKLPPLADRITEFEKQLIEKELRRNNGNISMVLESLQIPRQTLRNKMQKYNLNRKNFL